MNSVDFAGCTVGRKLFAMLSRSFVLSMTPLGLLAVVAIATTARGQGIALPGHVERDWPVRAEAGTVLANRESRAPVIRVSSSPAQRLSAQGASGSTGGTAGTGSTATTSSGAGPGATINTGAGATTRTGQGGTDNPGLGGAGNPAQGGGGTPGQIGNAPGQIGGERDGQISGDTPPQIDDAANAPNINRANDGARGGATPDLAFLFGAFVFWALSMFLVNEASGFQRWKTGGSDHAPNWGTAVPLSWLVSAAVFVMWGTVVTAATGPVSIEAAFRVAVVDPQRIVPAPLIAGIFAAAVAATKFAVYSGARIGGPAMESVGAWSLPATIGAALSLLHLFASIATLVMFRSYLFEGL